MQVTLSFAERRCECAAQSDISLLLEGRSAPHECWRQINLQAGNIFCNACRFSVQRFPKRFSRFLKNN